MEQILLNRIPELFEEMSPRIAKFSRETYSDSFQEFLSKYEELWRGLSALCQEEDEQKREEECNEFAKHLAKFGGDMRASETKKTKRNKMQLDLNLYMVTYVLPAIIEYYKENVGPVKKTEALTDAICNAWMEYPDSGHIEASDFDSIKSGFKTKLCFVTTAVCTGLNKPQDCHEVMLMKQYRDTYLSSQPGGNGLIEEYYDIAPTIVKRIEKEESPQRVYQMLWERYISPCVHMVEEGKLQECRELYEKMVDSLKREYMVTNTH